MSLPSERATTQDRPDNNLFMPRQLRRAGAANITLRGAAAHAVLIETAGRFAGAIKTGNHLAVHVDHLASRIDSQTDRKSTRLNSSHIQKSRMPSSA